jgi:rare lipoprotein A
MLTLTLAFASIASWYGHPYHGRLTASGEVYNMNAMTAAHRTLPFGTKLRVCNPRNNRCATVRINDRGPFIGGRDIDLSKAAADAIGIRSQGVGQVTIRSIYK